MKILTPENYYDNDEYMSVSSFKLFKECEVRGLQGFGEPTDSMMVGSYVDAFVEGTLEDFKAKNPSIFSSRGETKGQLKSEYKKAEEICEFIKNDTVFQQFMSGQKQTIMTGKIGDIPFKIKMDSYSPSIAINDLKVLKTVTDGKGNYYDFITAWGYDIQMACYQEIVYQNTGERLPCFICAVTKESPINSVIVNVPQYIMDRTLYTVEYDIQHFYDVKMGKLAPIGCGKCNACIQSRTETPIISMEEFVDFM